MTQTRWAVDGPDGTSLELGGRKYSSNDEGAPMMCNLVCSSLGRHVHVDYCRAGVDGTCDGPDVQHLNGRIFPNPDRQKDWITHGLSWRRMGASRISFVLAQSPDTSFRLQRLHLLVFSAGIFTETGTQTHILVTNRRTLQNGLSSSPSSTQMLTLCHTAAMPCAQVCHYAEYIATVS